MEFLNKIDDQWVPLQINVFSRWVQLQLNGKSNSKVEDITKDLSSGVALCELATILTKKQPRRNWVREPTRTVDMVQNCELAIKMFENDGVHFVGISGKDINDNKEKLILGLVWSLILHYSVVKSVENEKEKGLSNNNTVPNNAAREEKNGPETLLNWAADRTANYPHVDNFKPYNLTMCALLDTYVPDKINYDKLDPKDSEKNTKLATDVMKDLGIPVLVLPEEIEKNHNQVDNKSLLTQLSSAKFVLDQSFNGSENFRRSAMTSDASQMSSEVGERIALDSTKTEGDTLKARNANANGKYDGSNLIDLTSIPMNLDHQNNGNQANGSNLIDLNSIPVIQNGQKNREHGSILAFGQNGKDGAAANAGKNDTAVESSSEVDSTSSEVDTYDDSEEGENGHRKGVKGAVGPDGKPIAGVNGFDSNGHPIGPDGKPITGVNGSSINGNGVSGVAGAIGPDGKPITGVNGNGFGANGTGSGVNGINGVTGSGISGVNGVNGNGFGANGNNKGALGPDGKPISGTAGFDANGHPISSGVNGAGFGVNGANKGALGPDGKPLSGVNGNGFGVNGTGSGVNGVNGTTGSSVSGVNGPNGTLSSGATRFDANGHPILSGVTGMTGPDGKPISGTAGLDANGHPISSGVNGTGFGVNGANKGALGPDGKPLTGVNGTGFGVNGANKGALGPDGKPILGTAGFDSNGHPISSGANGVAGAVGPDGKPISGVNGSGFGVNGVNKGALGPDGKPLTGVNGTGFGANGANKGALGPDGKPILGTAGFDSNGHPISSGVNGTGSGINGINGGLHEATSASGVAGALGPDGKPLTGVNGTGFGANGANKGALGPDGKPLTGVNGTGFGVNGANKGALGPDGKPILGTAGFDSNGHPISSGANGVTGSGVGANGVAGAVGPDGKPISGANGNGFGVNGVNKGALGPDGKPISGVNGLDSNGHPISSGANGVTGSGVGANGVAGAVGPDGKPISGANGNGFGVNKGALGPDGKPISGVNALDSNGHPIPTGANGKGINGAHGLGATSERDVALGSNGRAGVDGKSGSKVGGEAGDDVDGEGHSGSDKEMIVLNLEDKYLTRKMSIRHVKRCKVGENVYNAALPWYISISGKRRHDEILRSQQFNNEDTLLTRRMSLPHFRFVKETPKPVEQAKSDDQVEEIDPEVEARNKANAEYDAEQAKNSIKQSPEDKVLTRNMSIRHIKSCKDGERNYFDNNLPWYVSISGKKRGSPEETKNVTRDFELTPEDVVLTRKMSIPRYNDPKCTESYKQEQKKLHDEMVAKRREARLAQQEEDKKYMEENAHKGIELTPEDKVLTRKMSIRHIKLCKDGEKNYNDTKLPWYVSISGKRRGSADECKADTRDCKFGPEDIVLTRHMSLPQFVAVSDDPEDNEPVEAAAAPEVKSRDVNLEQPEEEVVEETPEEKAKEFNLEDKVLTRKLSIRHIRMLKPGEKNYKRPCLPWYVSTSGKWRGSHNEQKAVTRDVEFDQEDKLLTRKLNLPHYVRPKCDEKGSNNNYTACHMFDVKKKWW